ncbi:MAG: hypothetical protein ABSD20_20710 [Terriglobales bacterium]|jgi:GNAT superfamily N-acetyltransferase
MAVITFRYDLPLEQTMAFEDVYHPNLRLSLLDKQDLRDAPDAIFVWMLSDRTLAGEAYGIPLSCWNEPIQGLSRLTNAERRDAVYCYSNTVLPAFQRQGLGTILKAHWLGLVLARGFRVVYGHARPGGSQALNLKFGAALLDGFQDWYGTGEEYRLYRLALE